MVYFLFLLFILLHLGSKKLLQTFNFPCKLCQQPVSAEVTLIFMFFIQKMLCVVPLHVNATFNCSSHKKYLL